MPDRASGLPGRGGSSKDVLAATTCNSPSAASQPRDLNRSTPSLSHIFEIEGDTASARCMALPDGAGLEDLRNMGTKFGDVMAFHVDIDYGTSSSSSPRCWG
jgi:hypothetical protein